MNVVLTQDEARRAGEEEGAPVTAICVWTNAETLEAFRNFLSAIQHDASEDFAPLRGLISDMRRGRVSGTEHTASQLRERLQKQRHTPFVLVDPGPEQSVRPIDEFLT
jgi:hypothetical protein